MSAKSDPVTPKVRDEVISRDREEMVHFLVSHLYCWHEIKAYLAKNPVCVAPMLDPSQWGSCWGRSTLDHIKDYARMGVRAESDPDHLVTLCQGHTEDGRKAGYQWNTAHRPLLRSYLRGEWEYE